MKIEIQNTKQGFVSLWRELERTRQRFEAEYRRFCIRRVVRDWMGAEATDDFIWEVCNECEQEGYALLPAPAEEPRKSREFLRALVTVKLSLKPNSLNRRALDAAYSQVFPDSLPLNIVKTRKPNARKGRRRHYLPLVGEPFGVC